VRISIVIRADPGTTTGQTIYISDPEVKTSALISVANNIFGPGGHLLYSTTDYCSIIIPGNAEATVGVNTFITSPMSTPECQQRLELSQWNANQTYQLCRCARLIGVSSQIQLPFSSILLPRDAMHKRDLCRISCAKKSCLHPASKREREVTVYDSTLKAQIRHSCDGRGGLFL